MEREKPTYELVIVANDEDMDVVIPHLDLYHKNLHPSKIVIICPSNSTSKFQNEMQIPYVEIVDESDIFPGLSLNSISDIITKIGGESARAGWYLQQFLKMGYAFTSSTPDYLIWDADTIPLIHLNYYSEDKIPIFTIKNEFHKPYFDTLEKLLGYGKQIQKSFIAEHMLINKQRMIELVSTIESNASIPGLSFFEKIMYSIDSNNLSGSGFSEFETYGSFIVYNYPTTYTMRTLRTARHARKILGLKPSEQSLKWFSECYDTLSLEKWDAEIPILKSLSQKRIFHRIVPAMYVYNFVMVWNNLWNAINKKVRALNDK